MIGNSTITTGNIELETVACDLCGDSEYSRIIESRDLNQGIPGQYQLVQCGRCGLIFQNPRPTAGSLRLCYPSAYEPHTRELASPPDKTSTWRDRLAKARETAGDIYLFRSGKPANLRKRILSFPAYLHARIFNLTLLPKQYPGWALLDVGCGSGNFLADMARKGWDVWGIEPNYNAAQKAIAAIGSQVSVGTIDTCSFPDESFDLITMWHVLEHVPSPTRALQKVFRLLKPGGWLVTMAPNISSANFYIFQGNWYHLDLPRHLYHFSPKTLAQLIESSGLKLERLNTQPDAYGLRGSLRNRLGKTADDKRWPGNSQFALQISYAFSVALSHARLSDQMIAYSQKPPCEGQSITLAGQQIRNNEKNR
jgi:2-polyprenyl-3-methyl-5-hydroxy-6-metoxy-1,4-benzoquinol methylase